MFSNGSTSLCWHQRVEPVCLMDTCRALPMELAAGTETQEELLNLRSAVCPTADAETAEHFDGVAGAESTCQLCADRTACGLKAGVGASCGLRAGAGTSAVGMEVAERSN
jgi:hypothetical protein